MQAEFRSKLIMNSTTFIKSLLDLSGSNTDKWKFGLILWFNMVLCEYSSSTNQTLFDPILLQAVNPPDMSFLPYVTHTYLIQSNFLDLSFIPYVIRT